MKLFSLILSILVFITSLYFFILKIAYVDSLNDIIYVCLLVVLMAICIVGVIINWNFIRQPGYNKLMFFVSNTYSDKKNK
jgi:hypothetical protein